MNYPQNIHKADQRNWLSRLVGMALRMKRRSDARSRGLVVTPWSSRSPGGWSA